MLPEQPLYTITPAGGRVYLFICYSQGLEKGLKCLLRSSHGCLHCAPQPISLVSKLLPRLWAAGVDPGGHGK